MRRNWHTLTSRVFISSLWTMSSSTMPPFMALTGSAEANLERSTPVLSGVLADVMPCVIIPGVRGLEMMPVAPLSLSQASNSLSLSASAALRALLSPLFSADSASLSARIWEVRFRAESTADLPAAMAFVASSCCSVRVLSSPDVFSSSPLSLFTSSLSFSPSLSLARSESCYKQSE